MARDGEDIVAEHGSDIAAGIEQLSEEADEHARATTDFEGNTIEAEDPADDDAELESDGAEGEGDEVDEEAGEDEEPAEEVDEDDDDVDDDDLDDDAAAGEVEGEEAAPGVVTREDGAQWNAEAGRWVKDGAFVKGEPPTQEQLAAAAKGGKDGEAEGAAPAWEPFKLKVDRKDVTLDEAVVQFRKGSDGKDYAFIAVPKEQFNRFTSRIGVGVVAQRMSRDLNAKLNEVDQIRSELEEERRHPVPTAEQVEAQVWLDALKKKTVEGEDGQQVALLKTIFTPLELENLELRAKAALTDAKEKFQTEAATRRSEREAAATEEQTAVTGLGDQIEGVANEFPEFRGLTEAQLNEVFEDLKPFRRALYWREGNDWYVNKQGIYDALRKKAAAAASAGGGAPAPRPAGGKPAQTGKANAGKSRDEAFNQGQRTAARPATTSLKARRDANQRPGKEPANREVRRSGQEQGKKNGRRKGETVEQYHERRHRERTRRFMNSDTLDFE